MPPDDMDEPVEVDVQRKRSKPPTVYELGADEEQTAGHDDQQPVGHDGQQAVAQVERGARRAVGHRRR